MSVHTIIIIYIFKVQYPMYINIRVQLTVHNMGCIIYNNMTIIKYLMSWYILPRLHTINICAE